MSTMTASRQTVKPSRKVSPKAADAFTCCVSINHVCYNVTPITGIEHPDVLRAFRVENLSSHEVYDVAGWVAGPVECTCPSYEMTHRGNGPGMCKHVRALVALGLLDAPHAPDATKAPAPAPAPAPVVVPAPAVSEISDKRPVPAPAPVIDWQAVSADHLLPLPEAWKGLPEAEKSAVLAARQSARSAARRAKLDADVTTHLDARKADEPVQVDRPYEPSIEERREVASWTPSEWRRRVTNRSSRSAVVMNFSDADAMQARGYA